MSEDIITPPSIPNTHSYSIFLSSASERFFNPKMRMSTFAMLAMLACVSITTVHAESSVMSNLVQKGPSFLFHYFNFVDGFEIPGMRGWFVRTGNKFNEAKRGEKVGIISYGDYAKEVFGKEFPMAFFDQYFTGRNVPSWEDNERHASGAKYLKNGVASLRALGSEPMNNVNDVEDRFSYDNAGIHEYTWDGFTYMESHEIKYASNGVHGHDIVQHLQSVKYNTIDTLGVLVTDSVFGAHLTHNAADDTYTIDLSFMSQYEPLNNFAKLGGIATFKLNTVKRMFETQTITHTDGVVYYPVSDDVTVNAGFAASRLVGWRFAEKVFISSLMSMTNLVMHVKNLHLEMSSVTQAVTIDYFSEDPDHSIRRVLDPFIHRSIQATNDNLRLLFDYRAAEFSLAPLVMEEQLRLMDDSIRTNPLSLAEMDMENYAAVRNMPSALSEAGPNGETPIWRWHYRTLTVQRLFEEMIRCWLDANGLNTDEAIAADGNLAEWYTGMKQHMPSLARSVALTPEWAGETLTKEGLVNVLKTLMVWLSWVHEDVGHSAAAYVYNPIDTPMSVPLDGVGIPKTPYLFNAVAYRGFVFLERAKLLDSPPSHWFSGTTDKQCFVRFQSSLKGLGASDPAFAECDKNGFYSCVDRVETAVSS